MQLLIKEYKMVAAVNPLLDVAHPAFWLLVTILSLGAVLPKLIGHGDKWWADLYVAKCLFVLVAVYLLPGVVIVVESKLGVYFLSSIIVETGLFDHFETIYAPLFWFAENQ